MTDDWFDVAIVGSGPAGAALALALARGGARVVMVGDDRPNGVGECLESRSLPVLAQLGWKLDETRDHRPNRGRVIVLPEGTVEVDPLRDPRGHGLLLDRVRFDAELRTAAVEAGAAAVLGTCTSAVPQDHGVALTVRWRGGHRTVRAAFAVDASGRTAMVARRLGGHRVSVDRWTCVRSTFEGRAEDGRLLVHMADRGYFYSVGLADRVVISFHAPHAPLGMPPLPPRLVARVDGRRLLRTRRYAAGSSYLDRTHGDRWVAIGDAAYAHDPLAGIGLHAALTEAAAIAQTLLGPSTLRATEFVRHATVRAAAYDSYLRSLPLARARLDASRTPWSRRLLREPNVEPVIPTAAVGA